MEELPARSRSCLPLTRVSSCSSRRNQRRRNRANRVAVKRDMSIHHSNSSMPPKASQVYLKQSLLEEFWSVPCSYPSVRMKDSILRSHASIKTRSRWTDFTTNSKSQITNFQPIKNQRTKSSSLANRRLAWTRSPSMNNSSRSSWRPPSRTIRMSLPRLDPLCASHRRSCREQIKSKTLSMGA